MRFTQRLPSSRTTASLAITGCLLVAIAYVLVLPVFGVVSRVTWAVGWVGWLLALAALGCGAVRMTIGRRPLPAAGLAGLLALVVATMWLLGSPSATVDRYVAQHRAQLTKLADLYEHGQPNSVSLPWWNRHLSIDGQAHHRCGLTDPGRGERDCALYLPMWQSWRGEQGAGIAYYPNPPGPGAAIVTAAGDTGVPIRHLGHGWWLVG